MKISTFNARFLVFSFLVFSSQIIVAQCITPSAQIDLNVNNVSARVQSGGSLWWDGSSGKYVFPKDSGISALFAGGFWMGGYDNNNILHLAAQQYGIAQGNTDYWPGPLDDDGLTDENTCANWDRFFVVKREDIDVHRADWADNNVIDGNVPNSILGWPGKGNPNFMDANGFDIINSSSPLAPFFDQNSNGIYEPMEGDYPLVKGDESIWWVFNDQGGGAPHGESGGIRLKMEIHGNAFSFTGDGDVGNTTFYDFKFIFKGNFPLNDFYLSLWVDADLGCYMDDFFGCISEEELVVVYNEDEVDADCFGTVPSYGDEVPILGIKVIDAFVPGNSASTGMSKFMYYENEGFGSPNLSMSSPQLPAEYHNYMKGIWRDGTLLSQGGNGYDPIADQYDYAFDGNPADATAWTQCTADLPEGDRRFLMSFGPYTLNPGDIGDLSFAIVTLPEAEYPCPDVSGLIDSANDMKEFYEEQCAQIMTSTNEFIENGMVSIAPNPASNEIMIGIKEANVELENIQLFSVDGKVMKNIEGISGQSKIIGLNDFSSGVYIYRAALDNGKLATGRFVVKK